MILKLLLISFSAICGGGFALYGLVEFLKAAMYSSPHSDLLSSAVGGLVAIPFGLCAAWIILLWLHRPRGVRQGEHEVKYIETR